jgi:two-component system sensor kinase FixL
MVAADGRIVWLCDLVSVTVEDGEPATLRGFMVDITERKEAQEESRRRREELTRVSRAVALGEIGGSLAHELNQPLSAIMTNAQSGRRLLEKSPPDLEELGEALTEIIEDSERAGEVIRGMRALLKRGDVEKATLDMNEIVQDVVALTRSEALVPNVSIRIELAEELPPVRGARVLLQQVLMNLILNGSEAMGVSSRADANELSIRTSSDGKQVEVQVRDAGVGLDSESVNRIFDPFVTSKADGLGIGLSISRSIVEAHGGRLWATQNPDGGATFYFTVPRKIARARP